MIALAAGRVARAISVDQITEPVRARIDRWADGGSGPAPVRTTLAALVRCPVCVGWWTSLALSSSWPGRMRLRRGVAAAGVQVLLTLVERVVSESGRAAIHQADVVERENEAA